ncbi:MAG: hypothetical protein Q4C17_00445 [Bacillota bacterium]|nr:hypothetical protein [Bacillota bacterium]
MLIALIMLMSAAPVFAEEVQQTEEVLQTEGTLQTEKNQDEAAESEKAAEDSGGEVKDEPAGSSSAPEPGKEEQKLTLEITLYDVDENKLEDKAAIQFDKGMTLEKVMELFNEERHYEIIWEKCKYIINDIEEENIDIKEYKPEQGDSIEIRITAEAVSPEPEQEEIREEEIQLAAVDPNKLEKVYNDTQKTIAGMGASSEWAFGSEWVVIGLTRSDSMNSSDITKYCDRIAAYVSDKKSETLHSTLSSNNSRLIISLTSLGYDPTDVGGYNLLKPLSDMNYVTRQGLSGPVWALIAFDSHNYEIPKTDPGKNQTTREKLISLLLATQITKNGLKTGWDMSGKTPDVDMTCMVLQALAPYNNDRNPAVQEAVANALKWLSDLQQSDGSFSTYDKSSESQSQVIVALTSLGINPAEDERFVKNGNSALDALTSFYYKGGFKHIEANWKYNSLATQQGYYALTAYYRFLAGKSSLYDMTEIQLRKFAGTVKEGDTGSDTQKVETAGKAAGKTRSLGYLALGDGSADESLIKENFGVGDSKQDALSQEEAYNEYVKSVRLAKTLPWIYIAIGAVALIGIILLLRSRRTE